MKLTPVDFDPFAEDEKKKYKLTPVEGDPFKEVTNLSRAQAGASGFNSGILTGLPGLPVDTALNVADLARAGYGYIGGKLGLLKPEDLPSPLDRKGYVGSSAWLKDKIKQGGGSVLIDNPNPEDAASRFLHTTGMAAAGARTPGQLAAGSAAGASQATAEELGFGTEGQIIASLLPQGVGAAARAGTKAALVGGGEKARAEFEKNLRALRDAGVETPSAGLAGPRATAGLEAMGSRYPGSAGLLAENAKNTQAQLGTRVRDIADQTSANRGDAATGQATQQDITQRWKPKFDEIYERLDNAVTGKVGPGEVPINNTLATTGDIASGILNAPNVSAFLLGKSGIPSLDRALQMDARQRGPVQPGTEQLPYPALRATGTEIGKQAGDNLLHGNVESGRFKQVYGAIAEDKAAAAAAANAERELARANRFYSTGTDKMEGVLQAYTKDGITAEQAYNQFRSTVISSPTKAHDLRKSLSPEVRKMQTATLIDELGQATPGRQDAAGSLFSSETFLTNWNKLSPNSKAVIFSGFEGAGQVRTDLEKVAKAAELIRKKGGIYANPSGTSGAVAQMGVGGALVVGAVTANVPLLATTLTSVAGANITARMMTNPKFVNWLASSNQIVKPESAAFHVKRLGIVANQITDEETRRDVERFMESLAQ